MVVGGSLGSVAVNDAVRSVLPELLQSFQIVHLCGKGKIDESLKDLEGYAQFEYIKDELKDLFALDRSCYFKSRSQCDLANFLHCTNRIF